MLWEKREAEGVMKNSGVGGRLPRLGATRDVVHGDGGVHGSDRRPHRRRRSGEGAEWRRCRRRSSRCSASGRCTAGPSRPVRTPSGATASSSSVTRSGGSASAASRASSAASIMLNGSPVPGRRRAAGECRVSQHGEPDVSAARDSEAKRDPPSRTSHQFSVYRAAEAGRDVRAGAGGNGSHRQGPRGAVSATEPRSRRARDVAAGRDHRPRRAHARRADGRGRDSSC